VEQDCMMQAGRLMWMRLKKLIKIFHQIMEQGIDMAKLFMYIDKILANLKIVKNKCRKCGTELIAVLSDFIWHIKH